MIRMMTGNDSHVSEWAELVGEEVSESVRRREELSRRSAE